nr:hypothetical protein [Kibdelosporangium sp. MJ126-NF4]
MPRTVRIGPGHGKLLLRTGRQGLAAQAGHDLTIEVTRWSGELVLADELAESTLSVTADIGSLQVLHGKGGVKPLSEKDRREIVTTARRVLGADRHPDAVFRSSRIVVHGDGGTVEGTLSLHGTERPVTLSVGHPSEDVYTVTGAVIQTEFGIKLYSAFLGALKLADSVTVEAEIDVS